MSNEVQQHPDRLMLPGETDIKDADLRYYDVLENTAFDLYGLYNPREEGGFKRLPDELGKAVSRGVARLYTNTAGGRIRFCTDSAYVALRLTLPSIERMDHMTLIGTSGADLYEDHPETERSYHIGTFRPPLSMTEGYASICRFGMRKRRYFTINLPLYNDVTRVEIGLQEDAFIEGGMKYKNTLPVVFYGSSITQGACASRPGLCYENMLARRLNMDYINLGFSGCGRAEDNIVAYMAELPMSAFVSDYDHNAPTVEYLKDTHCKMYQKIRQKNPDTPYIMLSRPDFIKRFDDSVARRDVIFDTYRFAREQGDKNVYYIDGESFFKGEWEDSCTMEGTHPNDLGFHFMAEVIGNTLGKLILK